MATLKPGVGIAILNEDWHAAIVPAKAGLMQSAPVPREVSGKILPHENLGHTVKRILDKHVGRTPEYVALSMHEPMYDLGAWQRTAGTRIELTDPTVSTLLGLEHVKRQAGRTLLRRGGGTKDAPKGLLKVGSRHVSWTVDGRTMRTDLTAKDIADLSPAAEDFAASIHAANHNDPVQLLGDQGWVNAVRHLAQTGQFKPGAHTVSLLLAARQGDRIALQNFVAHMAWSATQPPLTDKGDPNYSVLFANHVAEFMFELLGRTIGLVAKKQELSTLFVQYNPIAASDSLRARLANPNYNVLTKAILRYDNDENSLSGRPEIVLVEARPQLAAEAYGAILLASHMAGALV